MERLAVIGGNEDTLRESHSREIAHVFTRG